MIAEACWVYFQSDGKRPEDCKYYEKEGT